jgi:hypothetical protein
MSGERLNLEPIKARLAAATPGPWRQMPSKNKGGVDRYVGTPGCDPVCEMSVIREKWGEDMCLIANAPIDLAALVQEVERLRRDREVNQAQVRSYEAALRWYAAPENWAEQVDDRGRETLRWRWADDNGNMAKTALDRWRENKKKIEPNPPG